MNKELKNLLISRNAEDVELGLIIARKINIPLNELTNVYCSADVQDHFEIFHRFLENNAHQKGRWKFTRWRKESALENSIENLKVYIKEGDKGNYKY